MDLMQINYLKDDRSLQVFHLFSAAAKNISLAPFINLFIIISVHKSSMARHQKPKRAPKRCLVQWEGQAGNNQLPHNGERTNSHIRDRESFLKLPILLSPLLLPKHKRAASWAWSQQRHLLQLLPLCDSHDFRSTSREPCAFFLPHITHVMEVRAVALIFMGRCSE